MYPIRCFKQRRLTVPVRQVPSGMLKEFNGQRLESTITGSRGRDSTDKNHRLPAAVNPCFSNELRLWHKRSWTSTRAKAT